MTGHIQSVIEKLRPASQALIHRMLDQDELPDEIARAVYRLSGERVSRPALTYYASCYAQRNQEHQQARAETDDFIRMAGKQGVKVPDLLRAVLIERLMLARRKKQLTKTDLFKLDDAERKRREFELKQKQSRLAGKQKKRELDLKERQAQLAEQRFALDREKAQATVDRLERKAAAGESLTPDDVRHIREIYGLYDDPEATETQRHGENES